MRRSSRRGGICGARAARSLAAASVLVAITTAAAAQQPPGGASPAAGSSHQPKTAILHASRAARPPLIDGRLTDEVWDAAEPVTGFTQQDPDEGQPATEQTVIRILYDNDAVYVGARMIDSDPAAISRRLSSRDGDADADRITIYLDPMHDHHSGVMFRVSASNVQKDSVLYNDSWDDDTWDAVWQSAVSVDDLGWSAEIRIPLSQLRYPHVDQPIWGFNAERLVRRKNETTWLERVPKTESGVASRMAHLTGIDGLQPQRHLELLPYTAARAEFIAPSNSGDPFNDGSRLLADLGLDIKYGLTSNLTLDGTVNPDFGQVEVDPAVINLSQFETFFDEKRPFFLEGAQTFNNFGRNGATDFWNFNASDPILFYSRRIGRAPQLTADGDFVAPPSATTILGAAKMTGKTPRGWNLAVLDAVTDDESARVMSGLARSRSIVEPATNYAAARVSRDIGRRAGVGMLTTAVMRSVESPRVGDALPQHAFVAGADGYWFLGDGREWVISGKFAGSYIDGTAVAITRAQRAPQRYFQRPDAPHVNYDPNRTSLSGSFGRLNLNRNGGNWRVNAALWGVSPGFEANDLGFMNTADRAGAHGVLSWRKTQPDRFTRQRSAWISKWYTWNFNRDLQGDGTNGNFSLTFHNYWGFGGGFGFSRGVLDDRLTRGGPLAATARSGGGGFGFNTDSRGSLSLGANVNFGGNEAGGRNRSGGLSLTFKPSPRLTVSTGPQLNASHIIAQYVRSVSDDTAAATYGGRYVFGLLDQTQLTMTTRASLIVTPTISVQVFAQPLIGSGDYVHFKELAAPRTFTFREYASPGADISLDPATNTYTVDPDASGPASTFTFSNPDYNVKSLRVNAVFRWELKPGSRLYGVWTRQQLDTRYAGTFDLGRDASALFSARGDDVFMIKLAYWVGR